MQVFLQLINFDELFALLTLIGLTVFIGAMMAERQPKTGGRAWKLSAAAFLFYAGIGLFTWGANDVSDLVVITIRAALAGALCLGLGLIGFSTVTGIKELLTPKEKEHLQFRVVEIAKPTSLQLPINPPKPPPPTREELATAALARYEEKLALIDKAKLDDFERNTAKERAKQCYMNELNEVIK